MEIGFMEATSRYPTFQSAISHCLNWGTKRNSRFDFSKSAVCGHDYILLNDSFFFCHRVADS